MATMAYPTLLLVILCAVLTVSSGMSLHKRIFGGNVCAPDERHYHVKLIGIEPIIHNMTLCGGSLISDQWILTAAHCLEDGWVLLANVGVHPVPGEWEIIPNNLIFREDNGHDIMLLKLPQPTHHQPVPLPDCTNRLQQDDTVRLAGFGPTAVDANGHIVPHLPDELQCVDMDVDNTNIAHLRQIDGQVFPQAPNQHWFYVGRNRCDVTGGDSGGAVEFNGMIYGVISTHGNPPCASPAGIIDVCEYMDWIQTTMQNNP